MGAGSHASEQPRQPPDHGLNEEFEEAIGAAIDINFNDPDILSTETISVFETMT
jgi:hypothetical protein